MASLMMIFRLAMATLWENRLRSALTLIGMVFGNAAVIATLSSNDGAKLYIAKQLASLGNKLMTADVGADSITDSDLSVIRRYADELEIAVKEQVVGFANIRFGHQNTEARVVAVDESYFKAMSLTLDEGRFLIAQENKDAEPTLVLGGRVKNRLFPNQSFVNSSVKVVIGDSPLVMTVIGSFREKGGTSGSELDGSIFISHELGRKISSANSGKLIMLLKDDNRSVFAKNQVKALLSPKFGEAFQRVDAREAIEKTKAIWGKQNLVGIILASISLITGGIGIMNIMLLSIHQRQKEIGLRKAVGAQNSEIAVQFLLETIIICVLGGVIGVLAGWLLGKQVAYMLGDWEASMSLVSVGVALGFSVLTGVVFGATPAMRAARIDPYDALRTG